MRLTFGMGIGALQTSCSCGWDDKAEQIEEIKVQHRVMRDVELHSGSVLLSSRAEEVALDSCCDVTAKEAMPVQPDKCQGTGLVHAALLRLLELEETEELRLSGLAKVRSRLNEAIQKDPSMMEHLRIFMDEDHLLLGYLRNSCHDEKAVCDKILLVAAFFRDYPIPRDAKAKAEMVRAMEAMTTQLKFRGKDGSAVLYIKNLNAMMELFDKFPILEVSAAMLEQFLVDLPRDENTQLCGVTFVEDLGNFSIFDMMKMKKDKAYMDMEKRQMELWNQGAFSFPLCRCYLLDAPWYFKGIWLVLRPFMSYDLREKMVFTTREEFCKSLANANPFDTSSAVALEAFA